MADTKSATRVTSARSSELRLSWAPVSTSCSRMLPSRSRSNSATVSVRRILLVSCISVTAAIETWRDWSIAEREDCSRSFSDLATAPVASSPAEVIVRATSAPLVAIDCENAWPRVSIDFSASDGDAVDFGRELGGLGAERLDQRAAPAVDHLRQPVGLLLHIGDDFVGLAGHGRAEALAGGEHRALDVGRGRLDLGADFVRRGDQRALRVLRRGLDVVGGIGGDRAERTLDVGRDRLDLAGCVGRGRRERVLRLARAAEDRGGGVGADRGQGALDVDRQRLDVVGGVRRSGDQRVLGFACAGGDRLGGGVAGHRQRTLDVGRQRFDLAVASAEAATSVFCASRAPEVMASAVAVPAIDSERSTSAAGT